MLHGMLVAGLLTIHPAGNVVLMKCQIGGRNQAQSYYRPVGNYIFAIGPEDTMAPDLVIGDGATQKPPPSCSW